MKLLWILLFGIFSLPLGARAYSCRTGNNQTSERPYAEYCLIKFMFDEDNETCIPEYAHGTPDFNGGNTAARGCHIREEGNAYCYCKEDNCNMDIVDFHNDLIAASDKTVLQPNMTAHSLCLIGSSKRECAIGDPQNMTFENRTGGHDCFLKLERKGSDEGFNVVGLGRIEIPNSYNERHIAIKPYCKRDGNIIICRCSENQCNIRNDTFLEEIELKDGDETVKQNTIQAIAAFTGDVETCGDSQQVVKFDENRTLTCMKHFKKDESGLCTSEFSLTTNEQNRTGCYAVHTEGKDKIVICVCATNTCGKEELMDLLASSNMRFDEDRCVNDIPTTTTTLASTTKPEQLTCLGYDEIEVTAEKEKASHVCFIDYHMDDGNCEVKGRGVEQANNSDTGCRIKKAEKEVVLRCTCGENKCNTILDGVMWKYVESNNTKHLALIECVNRKIYGGDYMECVPGVFARRSDGGCRIKFEQEKPKKGERTTGTKCLEPKVSALFKKVEPWNTCMISGFAMYCYCNSWNCISGKEYRGIIDVLRKPNFGKYVKHDVISCALSYYNLPAPQAPPTTTASTMKPLLETTTTFRPRTTSFSKTTYQTSSPLHTTTPEAKISTETLLLIGSIVIEVLIVVTILILVIVLVKKMKGGDKKADKAKGQQQLETPTDIKIENPVDINIENANDPTPSDEKGKASTPADAPTKTPIPSNEAAKAPTLSVVKAKASTPADEKVTAPASAELIPSIDQRRPAQPSLATRTEKVLGAKQSASNANMNTLRTAQPESSNNVTGDTTTCSGEGPKRQMSYESFQKLVGR